MRKDRVAGYVVAGAALLAVFAESVQEGDQTSIVYCLAAIAAVIYLFRMEGGETR